MMYYVNNMIKIAVTVALMCFLPTCVQQDQTGGLKTNSPITIKLPSAGFASFINSDFPADCLHAIVNVGNVPAHSQRVVRGKTYWFKGSKRDLFEKGRGDFPESHDKNNIELYVSYLSEQKMSPVDYVMTLFENHDIVILCERFHGEMTQYEFIYDLIKDRRFIDQVGNVFTEIGTSSINGELHDFLFADDLKENEIESQLLNIYRNLSWFPFWEKYNFFDFLGKMYRLNDSLSYDQKISICCSDMPFSWEGMTAKKYDEFRETLPERDRIMSQQIIDRFRKIEQSDQQRKKALVIMNYRHAFNDFTFSDGSKGDNVGRYLFEEFHDRVSNVMINSVALLPGTTDREAIYAPIHNGKWDAAFEAVGNPNVGFNFENSPFGEDYFDYFIFRKHDLKYKDVFTGFIFYEPLKSHIQIFAVPHLFDDGYDKIILQRMTLTGHPIEEDRAQQLILEYEKIRELSYDNMDDMEKTIKSWL